MPLDGYLERDPTVLARLKPEIRKVLLDAGHGHIYSLPYAQFVQALYYRKDMFQAAGLDPDKPPPELGRVLRRRPETDRPAQRRLGL